MSIRKFLIFSLMFITISVLIGCNLKNNIEVSDDGSVR